MKIREQRIVEIKDKNDVVKETYTVTKLNATSGVKYFKIVQKLIVPILLRQEGSTMADLLKLASEKINDLDESDVKSLVVESIGITPAQFELEFSGKLFTLYKLLQEIVFFNFEDVFTELGLEGI